MAEVGPYLAVSASYLAPAADNANISDAAFAAGIGGPGYVVGLAWRRGQCNLNVRRGTQVANQRQPSGGAEASLSQNLALIPAWQPSAAGWLPSFNLISAMSALQQAPSLPNAYSTAVNNVAWEAWRALWMNDHITLTPAIFYLSCSNGKYTAIGKTSNALDTVLVAHVRF